MLPEPLEEPPPPAPRASLSRSRAAVEVVLCSGYPTQLLTQLLLVAVLGPLALRPDAGGALSPTFIFAVTAIDTVVVLSLVLLFLRLSEESLRDVFFRHHRVSHELILGMMLLPVLFIVVIVAQLGITTFAPDLRNVEESPFMSLLQSPWLLAGFVVLVLVGGGIREEFQRAFLLHRFEQRLGGGRLGLGVTSLAFGLGHTLQGWDAAIITGLLGALWGAIYLTRRSVVSTVVNHALFNVSQIALGYAALVER